ncbi:MAG TPA: hypothetical protein VH165_13470 [Kofleriaceae bacterium]|jgi:hypothetical protein|nr:hypothetical protein [Kofleriaceae bacterium]
MRRALAAGLAMLLAMHADRARADPGAPEIDPARLRREDAQRLEAVQRRLEAGAPAEPRTGDSADGGAGGAGAGAGGGIDPRRAQRAGNDPNQRLAGLVLVGTAGATALVSASLFEIDALDPKHDHDAANTVAALLGVTAVITAVAGVGVLVSSRHPPRVQVAPVVTPQALGLAALGQF